MEQKKQFYILTFTKFICLVLCLVVGFIYISYDNTYFLKTNGKKIFGSTYMTMNNPYFEVVNNEIKKEIEARGDILITLDPALDVEKQNEQIYSLINQNVDAIFVNPIDWKKIEPALRVAKKEGIAIIVVDAPVEDNALVDCTIVSDNYDAGVQCAKDMMSRKEKANIILLEHSTTKSAKERINGFLDTIKDNPNYTVVNRAECEGQLELAMPVMEEMLNQTSAVDVVMALNDPSALGALAALESNGQNKDVIIYGVDGSPEVKFLIKTSDRIQGTVAQSPISFGQIAVTEMYDLLEGKVIEKEIIVPVTLIKKENIDNYDIVGWQ